MLTVLAPGMGRFVSHANNVQPFYSGSEKEPAEITLAPEARIAGRVVTKLPGVSVAGRTVSLRAAPGSGVVADPYKVTTDAEGRFEFGGLVAGTCNLYLIDHEPDGPCTYVVAEDAVTKPGEATAVTIELIEGRLVEGQVTDPEGRPIEGALVHAPLLSRTGDAILGFRTKADGRYRLRLPPGNVNLYVSDPSKGYARTNKSRARLTVEGTGPLAGPQLSVQLTRGVQLRLVDEAGNPARDVEIRRLSNHEQFLDLSQRPLRPDAEGRVTLDREQPLPFATGQRIAVQVHHKDGRMVEINETVPAGPELSIRVP
jgi:hypothetical protein